MAPPSQAALLIPHNPVAPVVEGECITTAVQAQSAQPAPLAKVLPVDLETLQVLAAEVVVDRAVQEQHQPLVVMAVMGEQG